MPTTKQIINEIAAHHRAFGGLCYEAYESNKQGSYMAALSCLFVLTELSLKYKLEIESDDRIGLQRVIQKAVAAGIIDVTEQAKLNEIRELRNKLFHEDHYQSFPLAIDGLLWPVYEDETKELLFDMYSDFVFKLVARFATDT